MEIVFDLTTLYRLTNMDSLEAFLYLFTHGGWVIILLVVIWGSFEIWLMGKQGKWFSTHKFIILAIDIPKDTEQTPKAVEQLFATLSGAHTPLSAKEIYWFGMFQLSFSFEIVSIDGYVQFLIRTPSQYRDLVESSIYSQYPDAEITEVEDYIDTVPDDYPNETHKIWGTEVVPFNNDVYPIKTYREFEDQVSGEFKTPMASLLETMSKIQVGEQIWIQIIVKPTGFDWVKRSMAEAYKIAGKKAPSKKSFLEKLISPITSLFFLSTGEEMFLQSGGGAGESDKKNDLPSLMLHLTPGEKNAIEAIENKASKLAFECKMRLIYISPLEKYSAARCVSQVFGSIKQFTALDLNGFKPDSKTKTTIHYILINWRTARRRRRIMAGYKYRSGVKGHNYFILNTEELATIWHFPDKFIKTPLLQKTSTKKAQAPASLPVSSMADDKGMISVDLKKQLAANQGDEEYHFDLDNDYYENKFPKQDASTVNTPNQKGSPPTNLPT
jgi:hypothetical protein